MHNPQVNMNLLQDTIGDILKRFKQLRYIPKTLDGQHIIERFYGVAIPAGAESLKLYHSFESGHNESELKKTNLKKAVENHAIKRMNKIE